MHMRLLSCPLMGKESYGQAGMAPSKSCFLAVLVLILEMLQSLLCLKWDWPDLSGLTLG